MTAQHKIGDLLCRGYWHHKWAKNNPIVGLIIEIINSQHFTYYKVFWNDGRLLNKELTEQDVMDYKTHLQTWIDNQK